MRHVSRKPSIRDRVGAYGWKLFIPESRSAASSLRHKVHSHRNYLCGLRSSPCSGPICLALRRPHPSLPTRYSLPFTLPSRSFSLPQPVAGPVPSDSSLSLQVIPPRLGVLVSWGGCGRIAHSEWLKQRKCVLTVPEAGRSRPRCGQDWLLLRTGRAGLLPAPFPASAGLRAMLASSACGSFTWLSAPILT